MFEKSINVAFYAVLIITLLSLSQLRDLRFDFNIEKFFPAGDSDLEFFNEHQTRYNSQIDDEYIFVAVRNNDGIFNHDFLSKSEELTAFIQELDHIITVYSITNARYFYTEEKKLAQQQVLHIDEPQKYIEDSLTLETYKEYKALYVSKDGHALAISAFNDQNLTDKEKDYLLNSINEKIDELGFDEAHVMAKILVERTYINEIQKNLSFYLIVSLTFIVLALSLLFRSIKAVIVSLLAIALSIAWTLGLMAYLDFPLDVISSLLPPVLAVICMSDIIHISLKYIEELRNNESKVDALKKTFKEVGLATFFTSITTSVGFLTLCISNVIPIRMFGMFAGIGVLFAFIITLVLIFSFYQESSVLKAAKEEKSELWWTGLLHSALRKLLRNRKVVIGSLIVLVLISIPFAFKIEVNSSLLQEIPEHHPILTEAAYIEDQFAGGRSFELALSLKDTNKTFLDYETLQQIEAIEDFLRNECGVGLMISPTSFIKSANRAYNGGDSAAFVVPSSNRAIAFYANQLVMSQWGRELMRYLPVEANKARISGKLPDLSIKEFAEIENRFAQFYSQVGFEAEMSYKMTGSAVLLDKISFQLSKNVFSGLFIAFLIISIIVGIMFRSLRMVFIVLICNVIPLLFMTAVMSILGVYLKADTSIIFAISFGIAVDDSIHFISRFKIELAKGKSVLYAVKHTYLTTGRAIVMTTLVLLIGFFSLLFSSFGGTFYIGLLVSLCLVFALILDLTLLPLMIGQLYKKEEKSNRLPIEQ